MRRLCVFASLAVLLVGSSLLFPAGAQAFPQGTPGQFYCPGLILANGATLPHCYGAINEDSRAQSDNPGTYFYGVRSLVFVPSMVIYPQVKGLFVMNALWLDDDTDSPYCYADIGIHAPCQIEIGFGADGEYPWAGEHLYWTDIRPTFGNCGGPAGCKYHLHITNSNIPIGFYALLSIANASPNIPQSTTWNVTAATGTGSQTFFRMASTNNQMNGERWEFGQELSSDRAIRVAGTNASAPKATFSFNQFLSLQNHWDALTSDGTPSWSYPYNNANNPPWAGWDNGNSPSHSFTGGAWYACTLNYNPNRAGGNPC